MPQMPPERKPKPKKSRKRNFFKKLLVGIAAAAPVALPIAASVLSRRDANQTGADDLTASALAGIAEATQREPRDDEQLDN